MATCPCCAETIEARARKCPHCGGGLVAHDDLVARLEEVEPDAGFGEQARAWPDDSLLRALRDHTDDYGPPRQRALLDELSRRGLLVPRPRRVERSHFDRLVTWAGLGLLALVLTALAAKAL